MPNPHGVVPLLVWIYSHHAAQSSEFLPRNVTSFHLINDTISIVNGVYHPLEATVKPAMQSFIKGMACHVPTERGCKAAIKDCDIYKQDNGSFCLILIKMSIADDTKWMMVITMTNLSHYQSYDSDHSIWYYSHLLPAPLRFPQKHNIWRYQQYRSLHRNGPRIEMRRTRLTASPTKQPSMFPTIAPTVSPTKLPTKHPTQHPTHSLTTQPIANSEEISPATFNVMTLLFSLSAIVLLLGIIVGLVRRNTNRHSMRMVSSENQLTHSIILHETAV
eukprot:88518_1